MALIAGSAAIVALNTHKFLQKLLIAIPAEPLLGINSVNMVVLTDVMSMDPMPKKKLATIGTIYMTPFSVV